MNFKRRFRRKLEAEGLAKRTRPRLKKYKQKHPKSAGWIDLRKPNGKNKKDK